MKLSGDPTVIKSNMTDDVCHVKLSFIVVVIYVCAIFVFAGFVFNKDKWIIRFLFYLIVLFPC